MIYDTKRFEIHRLDADFSVKMKSLGYYLKDLKQSKLKNPNIKEVLPACDLIVVDIRLVHERVDTWQEELTSSFYNMMANVGGTLGLCTGTSFLSGFFLILFFGNSLFHAVIAFLIWFWWAVFLGRPPPKGGRKALAKYKILKDWEKGSEGPSFLETRKMRSIRRETIRRSTAIKSEQSYVSRMLSLRFEKVNSFIIP